MSGYSPLDHLTLGELMAAADCCAEAASNLPDTILSDGGQRAYFLRGAIRKFLSAALQVDPIQADFDRCAEIMRKANGL